MATADFRIWYAMTQRSQEAAQLIASQETLSRPCASRAYYAAYQAVTAVLLYRGLLPPADREGWSHEDTPRLIEEHWAPLIAPLDRRRDLARRLADLYKLRVIADYVGSRAITPSAVRKAMAGSDFIVKVAGRLLP